ncbi:unnamed protein product [Ophioblennius macclurei]
MTRPNFQYSPDNVQGPGCPTDPSEVGLPGCSCLSRSCSGATCSCLRTHGGAYDGAGRLLDLAYPLPVFECNALCACGDSCSNRVVQMGIRLRLEVFGTRDRGWGVRTLEGIPLGAFVCEYAGEVVDLAEARRRQLSQSADDNNYIIAVREHAGNRDGGGGETVAETFVDPARVGNVGRFLNHSCLPNLLMLPVRVHSLIPRLALFAARNIDAHEELTFDYSGGYGNRRPADSTACDTDETDGLPRKACHCRTPDCTGFLPLDLSVLR